MINNTYHANKKLYKEFGNSTERAVLERNYSYISNPIVLHYANQTEDSLIKLIKTNANYPTIHVPSVRSLNYLAYKYKCKYQIKITVVKGKNLADHFVKFKEKYKDQPIGIIAYSSEHSLAHVTPLIFYYNSYDNSGYLLFLDLAGQNEKIFDAIQKELAVNQPDIKLYYTTQDRQADNFSCRSSALTLLRNALLHLKTVDPFTIFNHMKLAGEKIEELPPEWDYTEQIYLHTSNLDHHFAIRDLYSNTPHKRMNPRSVVQSRQQFAETVSVNYELHFRVEGNFGFYSTLQQGHVRKVLFTCQKVFNLYLFKKGRSYCTYLDELPKDLKTKSEIRTWQLQRCSQNYDLKNNYFIVPMNIEDSITIGQLREPSNPMEIFIEKILNE